MNTLAVINIKGGVGKTVSAVNLAAVLAAQDKKVLLIDLDAQANATQILNRFDTPHNATVRELFLEKNFDVKSAIISTDIENLDLIRSHISFAFAESQILIDTTRQQQTRLSKALKQIENDYDFCILDCPPNIGIVTVNALVAADNAIVPIKIDQFAVDGLDYLLQTLTDIKSEFNPSLQFVGSFITMDNHTVVNKAIKEELNKQKILNMFETSIPQNVKVPESTFAQAPVVISAPKSAAAQSYIELCEEYIERIGG